MNPVKDRSHLIGQKFGKWMVLNAYRKPGVRKWQLLCRCECGTERELQAEAVSEGRSTMCMTCSGICSRKLQVGGRYHGWTVLEYVRKEGSRTSKIRCRCDCGNISDLTTTSLMRGTSKKCMKCKAKAMRKGVTASHWTSVIRGAASRGIEVGITWDDALAVFHSQGGYCALSGLPITLPGGALQLRHRSDKTASLDRRDSTKGYIAGNVQWVHKDVNWMKNDFDEAYFVNLCTSIANKHRNQPHTLELSSTEVS